MRCDMCSQEKANNAKLWGPRALRLSPIWMEPTMKLLCSSYLETRTDHLQCPFPPLRWNPSSAGTRGWLFSCRKYSSLLSSCVHLCICSRYVLPFVLVLLSCPAWKVFIMVRIIPLYALAAFSLSPVHGINLDATSVGKSPVSLQDTQC